MYTYAHLLAEMGDFPFVTYTLHKVQSLFRQQIAFPLSRKTHCLPKLALRRETRHYNRHRPEGCLTEDKTEAEILIYRKNQLRLRQIISHLEKIYKFEKKKSFK